MAIRIRSLALRLTAMYALIAAASVSAIFFLSYLILQQSLSQQLDEELSNEIREYASLLESQNLDVVRDVLDREAISEGVDRILFRLLDEKGAELLSTDKSAWRGLRPKAESLHRAAAGETLFQSWTPEGHDFPARFVYGPAGDGRILEIGESTRPMRENLLLLRRVFAIAGALFLAVSVLLGWIMATGALRGLDRITQTAKRIAAGEWHSRVDEHPGNDELNELARAFNLMAAQTQAKLDRLSTVTDDIAHDLRTSIMRIRGTAETAIRASTDHASDEYVTGTIIEECDEMLTMINTALEIAEAESGRNETTSTSVDASLLISDLCDLFQTAAEDKQIRLEYHGPDSLQVLGESTKLKRAFANLLDNAIKYTPENGTINVSFGKNDGYFFAEFADTGSGIPDDQRERIFHRFYRVDRSRNESGHGLGLSLSRAICRAHGGDLTLVSPATHGAVFRAILPIS